MGKTDTIHLLEECDAGSKMAVQSIDDVIERVKDTGMQKLLQRNKEEHEKIGNEIHQLLNQSGYEDKEPNPMAKGMAKMKTGMKMGMDDSDATAANLITDGCNMGVKSLNRYKNQYASADPQSIHLCNDLIELEEKLCKDLQRYL